MIIADNHLFSCNSNILLYNILLQESWIFMESRENIYQKLENYYLSGSTLSAEEFIKFFQTYHYFTGEEITRKERDALIKRIIDFLCEEKSFEMAKDQVHRDIENVMEAIAIICRTNTNIWVDVIGMTILKRNLTIISSILYEIEDHLEKLQQSYLMSYLPKLLSLYVNGKLTKDKMKSIFTSTPSIEERKRLLGKSPRIACGLQTRMDEDISYPSTIVLSSFGCMITFRTQMKESIRKMMQNHTEDLASFMEYLTQNDLDIIQPNLNLFLKAIRELAETKIQNKQKLCLLPGQKSLF